jgi:hemerythrin-like domain-containing protein
MHVIDHLIEEHDQAKKVMQQLTDKPEKRLFEQLRNALDQHLGGEETVVYRAMDELPGLHRMVLEGVEEHRIVRRLLDEIEKLEPKDERWQAKFKVLRQNVEHHIAEEEGQVFPQARQFMDEDMAEELDVKYSEAEKRIAA